MTKINGNGLNLFGALMIGKRAQPAENHAIFKDFSLISRDFRGFITLVFTELEWRYVTTLGLLISMPGAHGFCS